MMMADRQYHWIVVRCCCTPTKIFGFIRIPERLYRPGIMRLPMRSQLHSMGTIDDARTTDALLEVKTIYRGREIELAVYSDDRPYQFWMDVDGFIPAEGML
jgi:hypothetical protein